MVIKAMKKKREERIESAMCVPVTVCIVLFVMGWPGWPQ